MGHYKVVKGDFISSLRTLKRNSVALALTSPPYEDSRLYGDAKDSWRAKRDLRRLGRELLRVLKPGGVAAIVISAPIRAYRDGYGTERGTSHIDLVRWWRKLGFRYIDTIVYGRIGAPGKWPERLRNDWEPLHIFAKPGAAITCHHSTLAIEADATPKRGTCTVRKKDGTMNRSKIGGENVEYGLRNPGTLWWYGQIGGGNDPSTATGHPAVFAERMACDIVRVFSTEGDLVIDPFVGSGTTGVAASRYHRRFWGCDKWAKAVKMARKRIGGAAGIPTLFTCKTRHHAPKEYGIHDVPLLLEKQRARDKRTRRSRR